MVPDSRTMTLTVGSRVFDKPDFHRRPEWDFDFKGEICGYPDSVREQKTWHKFYAAKLGPRFNFRFFAANYWLWLGDRMSVRTGNMLRYEGKHWHVYDPGLVQKAHAVLPYVNEAERDGLFNLVPLIIAHQASPQEIKSRIGRGLWRRAANNSTTRNVLLMKAFGRCPSITRPDAFARLMEMPSGVLRFVMSADDDEVIAARIAPKKRGEEFRQTVHLVLDTKRMLDDEFNPDWSYLRMRQEHERASRNLLLQRYSDKKFAPDWTFEEKGYTATFLNSKADIATEGAVQHHCVASYTSQAAKLQYSVFRIEGKERATLGSVRGSVNQVYGACNARVSDDCMAFARKVAAQHFASARKVLEAA